MKTKRHSSFFLLPSAFALLAALALCFTATPARAQTNGGYALSFNGLNNYVNVPQEDALNPYPLTISAWMQTTQNTASGGGLINKYVSSSYNGYQLFLANGDVHAWYFQGGAPASYRGVFGGGNGLDGGFVADGAWHHIAFVVATNGGSLYVDGTLKASLPWTGAPGATTTTEPISLGVYPGSTSSSWFSGLLDEVRIWNVARSQTDIQADMLQRLTGAEPGLVAYWRLDEGTGTTAYDATTNHFDGTLENGTGWVPSTLPYLVTLAAGSFTPTAATLNALVNPNGVETGAWFQWGADTNYGSTTAMTDLGSGTNAAPLSALLAGLATNVTYHYRIAVSNSVGVAYGSDGSFTILTATSLADSGAGSLRQTFANAPAGATIVLTNTGTITLTSGELLINKNLNIVGPGATNLAISGNDSSPVFYVTNAAVNISGLTIRYGKSADGAAGVAGWPGGGIYNAGVLTLSDCIVTNNRAGNGGAGNNGTGNGGPGESGGAGGAGGGIYNAGTGALWLDRCTISGNASGSGALGGTGATGANENTSSGDPGGTGGPGGNGGAGAGVSSDGQLTMNDCTVTANHNGVGGVGGLAGNGGENTTWGGIHYHWGGNGGTGGVGGVGGCGGGVNGNVKTAEGNCTSSGNANGQGGVGGNGGGGGSGSTTGHGGAGGNGGNGGSGGGIYNNGLLALIECTIASDTTAAGGTGGAVGSGSSPLGPAGATGAVGTGGGVCNGGTAQAPSLVNTIVGLNNEPGNIPDDVWGAFSSLGHNLIGNASGSTGFASSDLLNINPVLGSLADNGGPTLTQTPLPGSPAIDAGDNTYASATDQRGLPRIVDGTVDIGAVEFQYWPVVTTLPASDVSGTNAVACATLNGTVNPDGPIPTTAWFEWLDGSGSHQTTPIAVGTGTNNVAVSADVPGLTAGLTYRYRLVATNAIRGFDYGHELRFCAPVITVTPLTWTCHDVWVEPGAPVSGSPIFLAAGMSDSLALKADGTVVGWGYNGYGETTPPTGLSNVVAIAGGYIHSLALQADGTVVGWGDNGEGQTSIPAGWNNVVAIAGGDDDSLALQADGTVVGWGANYCGETNVPTGLSNVVAIAAGADHSLALQADGTVAGWGDNGYGETSVPAGLNSVVAIAAGLYDSLALHADGTVVGWGYNSYGETTPPTGLSNVVAIAAGAYHSLALKADGTVVGWGHNGYGEISIPTGLSNVVAIAGGYNHSLAFQADGTVVGWGDNGYGETSVPPGLDLLNDSVGITGTVDVNVPGTYVLTYTTTNAFGGVGMTTRTVTVIPATPLVTTQPATAVGSAAATLQGVVNPRGAETLAWFEYGLTTKYGGSTAATDLGSYPYDLGISNTLTNLLPWMTYHFRAVASNSVGRIDGPDATFTLSSPFGAAPALAGLQDLAISQGGSTVVPFTASPAGLDVSVGCNNSVLLPNGGLALGGAGTSRSLTITPDPKQSGSAQITVTASDGMHEASSTFTLTVTPLYSNSFMCLTDAQKVAAEAWRFRVYDFGTASSNYVVQYRSNLDPTNLWTVATNVTWPSNDTVEVNTGPPQGSGGFYRVKGLRWLAAGLSSPGSTVNAGTAGGAVVVFNGLYTGTVTYTWGGTEGTNTGTVQVNGTTAVIPIPAAFVTNSAGSGQLQYLTLQLQGGTNFALAGTTQSSFTVEQNNAAWQGTLIFANGLAGTGTAMLTNSSGGGYTNVTLPQNANMTIGFTLEILQSSSGFQGQIESDGYGFFPTNALAQLTFTTDTFSAVSTNIPVPALTDSPLFSGPNHIDLRLDADNSQTNQSVSPTEISGVATLVSVVPGRPYLDTALSGVFVLLKPATPPSTNNVPLTPVQ
jgi:hypothetical protein